MASRLKVGGNDQPVPRNELNTLFIRISFLSTYLYCWKTGHNYTAMRCKGRPVLLRACRQLIRWQNLLQWYRAGLCILVSRLLLPSILPINTVATPGPVTGPPTCGTGPFESGQVCMSLIRAAAGIVVFLVDLYQ